MNVHRQRPSTRPPFAAMYLWRRWRSHRPPRSRSTACRAQPSATTTIDGKQLPPPPPKFGGVIKETAKDSKPYWPPRVVPPKGAPNVLLIMTDDQGYGVSGTFGGVIPTPAMDRIAKAGLRYTQFHSTALCSPTRAALITGRNHHSVGFGVIGEMSTGYPGYDSVIGPESATVGTILRDNGYATSWFGKNHNTPDLSVQRGRTLRPVAGRHGLPVLLRVHGRRDRPVDAVPLPRTRRQIFPWIGKPDYNLTTDMADEAIKYMSSLNAAAPDKPFFVYYVPGGTHSPHQPKKEWIEKFKGKFDMGCEKLREQIFANQKRLGVIPANTQLTPWPDDLPKWDSLSAVRKKLYAREAEVFAGYAAYTDHEIGRVIQAVEDMGKLDNTLIIYISGDNGTSAEGTLEGTPNQMTAYNAILDLPEAELMLNYEAWGSDKTYPHMSVAWSWAFDTPFKWTKQVASHFGGTRQGMVISWPGHIKDAGGIRTPVPSHDRHRADDPRSHGHPGAGHGQRHRAEAHRRREHGLHVRQGERQRAVEARDAVFRDVRQSRHLPRRLVRLHDAAGAAVGYGNGQAARCQRLQVGALQPHGGLLAEQRPRRQESRQAQGAAGVVPDGGGEIQRPAAWTTRSCRASSTPRPSATAGQDGLHLHGRERRHSRRQCAEHSEQGLHDHRRGDDSQRRRGGNDRDHGRPLRRLRPLPAQGQAGLRLQPPRSEAVSLGGRRGGGDWLGEALKPGKHTIVFDFKYDGPGLGKGGTGVLTVDGKELARQTMAHTIPFLMAIDETFDIGIDTRTAVDDSYKLPFRFTGTIDKLTFKLGPEQLTAEGARHDAEALAKARD